MPRWFITGGAGFIGSHFIRHTLAERPEIEILNFDSLTYAGCRENGADFESNPRYRFVSGDIRDREQVESAMDAFRPDAVVHFAAETHVDRSIGDTSVFVRTNALGTQVLLDAAVRHRVSRFLQVSTDEVYGSIAPKRRSTELDPLAPNSPYAASKAAGDHLARAAHRTFGLPVILTRGSNNYGPYQFPEKLIPLAIANADAGEPVPLYGRGDNVRNWLHVDDHCRGILAALEHGQPGEIYNLGGNDEVDNHSLLRRLLRLMDKPEGLIRLVADRPGHDQRYALDSSRARRELHWTPRIALEDGLRETIAWYRGHAEWLARRRDASYRAYYRQQYGSAPDGATVAPGAGAYPGAHS